MLIFFIGTLYRRCDLYTCRVSSNPRSTYREAVKITHNTRRIGHSKELRVFFQFFHLLGGCSFY